MPRDFGEYRAMFLDFGVDPRALDTMSLAEISSMSKALSRRRGKTPMPPKTEDREALMAFADIVKNDPSVRLN